MSAVQSTTFNSSCLLQALVTGNFEVQLYTRMCTVIDRDTLGIGSRVHGMLKLCFIHTVMKQNKSEKTHSRMITDVGTFIGPKRTVLRQFRIGYLTALKNCKC